MTASTAAAVNAPALHPVPERSAILKEQIGAVSVAIRKEQYFYVGTLIAFLILAVYGALAGGQSHAHGNMEFGPQAIIPMSLVALLMPVGVWRASDRERRGYDWAMPIAQSTNTIIRMFAGWLWLMLGVVIYVVFVLGVQAIVLAAGGGSLSLDVPAWIWLVPFTSTTIAYLLTSIAIIGSEHPWRWIGGIVVGYLAALLVLEMVHLPDIRTALQQVVGGYYGLAAAVFGALRSGIYDMAPSPTRWLGATAIWGALSIAGVWLAARRHSTS